MATVTTSHPRGRHTRAAAASAPSKAGNFIEPERRRAMISEAAYFLAERRGFCPGGELEDWLAAKVKSIGRSAPIRPKTAMADKRKTPKCNEPF